MVHGCMSEIQADDLEKEPIIIAAKIIAAGLDELAMSNRMIAEKRDC